MSVINTATNAVTATVPVGSGPLGVTVTSDGAKVYVANQGGNPFTSSGGSGNTVSAINASTNAVSGTATVGSGAFATAVTPDSSKVYVTNYGAGSGNTVSVVNPATNAVTATVTVGTGPLGIAITPDGSKAYVANNGAGNVSVINTTTNTVTATITVPHPVGVTVSRNGNTVFIRMAPIAKCG